MIDKANILSERLLGFASEIVKVTNKLRKTPAGKHIANQLLRSGTSAGANYEEVRAAQSQADFIHKMQLVLRETRETQYWLRLIQKSNLLNGFDLSQLLDETLQLMNIMAKSIITAKSRKL